MSFADPFRSRFEVFGRESNPLIDDLNQEAFDRLRKLLDLRDGGDGRVILLRAPRAGYGKTSVLQRLAAEFAGTHHFVRVNLVGGRRTDAARVLEHVLQALCHVLPDSTTLTDLDLLARRILALGLEPLVASGEVPCQDREGALTALREQPTETFDFHHDRAVTAHWTKSNFEILGPRLAAELARMSGASLREASYWVELLFRFATTAPDNVERSRLLFETVFRGDLQNQSESAAEERLHGLLALIGSVTRLVLIVDDTEGLSTHPPAALELASFLANVSQSCPGTLVLLSVNTDVWETAFLPLLPGGLADRLTEYTVSLEPMTKGQARDLVRSRAGERAAAVLDKLAWPDGDLFARQILKAASEAWEAVEAAAPLKLVEKPDYRRRDVKVFAKAAKEIDDLPESLEDDDLAGDELEAESGPGARAATGSAASPFRAGKEGKPGLAETIDDREDEGTKPETTAAGGAAQDLRAAATGETGEEGQKAEAKRTPTNAGDAAVERVPESERKAGDDSDAKAARPFAETSAQPPVAGASPNPFAPADAKKPGDETHADSAPGSAPVTGVAEATGANPAGEPEEVAAAPAAEKSPAMESPAAPAAPANPFKAVTPSPSGANSPNPFSAARTDSGESRSAAKREPEAGSPPGSRHDPAAADTTRPFASGPEETQAAGATSSSPFTAKPSAPASSSAGDQGAEAASGSAFGAPSFAASTPVASQSFTAKPEAASAASPPTSPFTGSQGRVEDKAASPPASPFSPKREDAGARENPFAPKFNQPVASSRSEVTGEPDARAEATSTSPTAATSAESDQSAKPPESVRPPATPPPLPPESPFSAGKPPISPASADPPRQASPPPMAPEAAPPAPPASPFAGMGGNAGGEKDLGKVASIFDPIRPGGDFTIDPAKLKPLRDHTEQASPATQPPATPDVTARKPGQPAAGSPPAPPAAPSGDALRKPDVGSPFKPVASTPDESPFSSKQPAEPASGFGTQAYRGLQEPSSGAGADDRTAEASRSEAIEPASSAGESQSEPTRESDSKAAGSDPDDDSSPFRSKPSEGAGSERASPPSSSTFASPFKPVALSAQTGEHVSPFAQAGAGSRSAALSPRTELPPKQAPPVAPPREPKPPSPFEAGRSPVENSPPPPTTSRDERSSAAERAGSSPFAAVGESDGEEMASVPATARPSDQDKVDELLRQFKARYAND